jgi:hypothetical protein
MTDSVTVSVSRVKSRDGTLPCHDEVLQCEVQPQANHPEETINLSIDGAGKKDYKGARVYEQLVYRKKTIRFQNIRIVRRPYILP